MKRGKLKGRLSLKASFLQKRKEGLKPFARKGGYKGHDKRGLLGGSFGKLGA
jgi:hypothetical protein